MTKGLDLLEAPASYQPPPGRALPPVARHLCQLEQLLLPYEMHDKRRQIIGKLKDLERPGELLVFIVGEGNFGKSSLINALLGKQVAGVSNLPLTWRIDVYRSADSQGEGARLRRAGDEWRTESPWLSLEDAEAHDTGLGGRAILRHQLRVLLRDEPLLPVDPTERATRIAVAPTGDHRVLPAKGQLVQPTPRTILPSAGPWPTTN